MLSRWYQNMNPIGSRMFLKLFHKLNQNNSCKNSFSISMILSHGRIVKSSWEGMLSQKLQKVFPLSLKFKWMSWMNPLVTLRMDFSILRIRTIHLFQILNQKSSQWNPFNLRRYKVTNKFWNFKKKKNKKTKLNLKSISLICSFLILSFKNWVLMNCVQG